MNLAQRKKKKNSKYWRNKADEAWSKAVKLRDGNKCCICDATDHLQAHHLLPKSSYSKYRHMISNGITLCPRHHSLGGESAHKNAVYFSEWLKANKSILFLWVLDAMAIKTKVKNNYKDAYERLTGDEQ